MTAKERLMAAQGNLRPEAVPDSLGLSELVPAREVGLNIDESS